MIEYDKHERKLVKEVAKYGFELLGITPFLNADKFYFYKKHKGILYNVEIIFNGQGYCLKLGKENVFKVIDMKYTLTWKTLFDNISLFASKKGGGNVQD